jgi:Cap4 SAVED domain
MHKCIIGQSWQKATICYTLAHPQKTGCLPRLSRAGKSFEKWDGAKNLCIIPPHISWLQDTGERKNTACGREIEIWALTPQEDGAILSAWARHFRQHYISDEELPAMVDGTGLGTADYLRTIKFPDAARAPGPSVRSGDFGEILVADYIEYLLGYWSPRTLRYQDRWNRNDSTKGCDIIGFKFATDEPHHPDDELFIFESKSGLTASARNRLQDAIFDSIKDRLREPMTLNAMKQRMLVRGQQDQAEKVKRFQNEAERPFRRMNGVAAILDNAVFDETDLTTSDATGHPNSQHLRLIIIRGPSLMTLVHALYERAADEA